LSARGNMDQAIDFCQNGFPEHLRQERLNFLQVHNRMQQLQQRPSQQPSQQPQSQQQSASPQSPAVASSPSSLPLLRANGTILNAMKLMAKDNPSQMPSLLRQLKQTNPEILKEINENQTDFLKIVKEPISMVSDDLMELDAPLGGEVPLEVRRMLATVAGVAPNAFDDVTVQHISETIQALVSNGDEGLTNRLKALTGNEAVNFSQFLDQFSSSIEDDMMDEDGQHLGGQQNPEQGTTVVVELTQEEMDDVNQLLSFFDGRFSRDDVLKAYLLSEKDKEKAANLLFEMEHS